MALGGDDIAEIGQLYARYCWALDDGDGPALAQLFTEDGVVDTMIRGVFTGHDEIGGYTPGIAPWDPRQHLAHDPADGMRHMAFNIDVDGDGDGDGDRATGRAYVLVARVPTGTPEVAFMGRVSDRFERTPDGWRFSYRQIRGDSPDWPSS